MPKLKTHRGTKKRIRVTKGGKLVHRHASQNHFLQKKRAARKRRLARTDVIKGRNIKIVKRNLGV